MRVKMRVEKAVHRIILLGASNLTIGFPRILEHLRSGLDGPIDVYAALGHGRSVGRWSRVLHRALPGIVGCELWDDLKRSERTPQTTLGLMTDVGNDLIYGASVAQIADWVETCFGRFAEERAEVVLTLLPIASIERLSAWRYQLTRMIFFPGGGPAWTEMRRRAFELNERLVELGGKYGIRTIEQPGKWYGFDPIHIRPRSRAAAWGEILAGWSSIAPSLSIERLSLRSRWRLRCCRPARRKVFGKQQTTAQPVLQLDQTTIFLY